MTRHSLVEHEVFINATFIAMRILTSITIIKTTIFNKRGLLRIIHIGVGIKLGQRIFQ